MAAAAAAGFDAAVASVANTPEIHMSLRDCFHHLYHLVGLVIVLGCCLFWLLSSLTIVLLIKYIASTHVFVAEILRGLYPETVGVAKELPAAAVSTTAAAKTTIPAPNAPNAVPAPLSPSQHPTSPIPAAPRPNAEPVDSKARVSPAEKIQRAQSIPKSPVAAPQTTLPAPTVNEHGYSKAQMDLAKELQREHEIGKREIREAKSIRPSRGGRGISTVFRAGPRAGSRAALSSRAPQRSNIPAKPFSKPESKAAPLSSTTNKLDENACPVAPRKASSARDLLLGFSQPSKTSGATTPLTPTMTRATSARQLLASHMPVAGSVPSNAAPDSDAPSSDEFEDRTYSPQSSATPFPPTYLSKKLQKFKANPSELDERFESARGNQSEIDVDARSALADDYDGDHESVESEVQREGSELAPQANDEGKSPPASSFKLGPEASTFPFKLESGADSPLVSTSSSPSGASTFFPQTGGADLSRSASAQSTTTNLQPGIAAFVPQDIMTTLVPSGSSGAKNTTLRPDATTFAPKRIDLASLSKHSNVQSPSLLSDAAAFNPQTATAPVPVSESTKIESASQSEEHTSEDESGSDTDSDSLVFFPGAPIAASRPIETAANSNVEENNEGGHPKNFNHEMYLAMRDSRRADMHVALNTREIVRNRYAQTGTASALKQLEQATQHYCNCRHQYKILLPTKELSAADEKRFPIFDDVKQYVPKMRSSSDSE